MRSPLYVARIKKWEVRNYDLENLKRRDLVASEGVYGKVMLMLLKEVVTRRAGRGSSGECSEYAMNVSMP